IWPDGSVQRVEVIFTVAAGQAGHYVLVYGQDVNQKSFLRETAVLPTVSFSLAGLPPPAENMDLPVGQINVRVERSPDIRYYWHLTPLAAIVFLLFLRRRRWNRMDKKQE
ncbi:MAG TPA: hypothetical protein PKW42_04315, partial [bacterium]|nr:hypothetical protein [bacterium]